MVTSTVLLVTASYDEAAALVSAKLEAAGVPAFRLDTDLFPSETTARFEPAAGEVVLTSPHGSITGGEIHSVWYRRNVASALPSSLDKYHKEFCQRESRAFLAGSLSTITTERWLSNPSAIWQAERKVYQLAVAKQLGFKIPRTIVTNDKAAAYEFANNKSTIAKAVSSGYIDSPNGYQAIFTSDLEQDDLADLDGLDLAPVIFQEKVQKISDVRITVVGQEVFAAEILSQDRPSSQTDWRATDDPDLVHKPHRLPQKTHDLCLALVSHLGLDFGAIDLALSSDGSYWFFEINPNGEWLWLEYQLGFPIAESIAKWLTT